MATLTRRQRKVLDYVRDYIERRGYAPTLGEIGRHFGLRSPATVHKHLHNLEQKGYLRRNWNHSRAIEVLPEEGTSTSYHLPLCGDIEGGRPLELQLADQTVPVPKGLVGEHRTYVLRVRGPAFRPLFIDHGDLVVIEECEAMRDGELALVVVLHQPWLARAEREGDVVVARVPGGPRLGPDHLHVRGRVLGILRAYS